MNFCLCLVLITVVAAFDFAGSVNVVNDPTQIDARSDCVPCKRPKDGTDNKPANVTNLELDKTQLQRPRAGQGEDQLPPQNSREMVVSVQTTALDPEGDVITYHYTISGGRVTGQGSRVSWDLNRLQPGTYTITVGVDDGCGICGNTMTQAVTITDPPANTR